MFEATSGMDAMVALSDADYLRALERVQAELNQLEHLRQVLVAEGARRRIHEPLGFASMTTVLTGHLNLSRAQAQQVNLLAQVTAPRTTLQGEVLPPRRPWVAEAQADGGITPAHASAITTALSRLPASVEPDQVSYLETVLVELARKAGPEKVARAGRHALALIDPDGAKPRDDAAQRRRGWWWRQRGDGMTELRALLTTEARATWEAVLGPLAAPRPEDANGKDDRTAAQRRHDAFLDAGQRLLQSGTLPESGGTPVTIAVTMTLDQLRTGTGTVVTSYGTDITVQQVLRLAAELEVIPTVLSQVGAVMAYGCTRRTASANQRKALRVRDKGCSFPGCQIPAEWCQAHHVRPWHRHGLTDLDNLTLVCGLHHRSFEKWGWTVQMHDGVPLWIPPPTLDSDQAPRRNTAHDLPELRC